MKTMNRRGVLFVLAVGGLTFLAAGVFLEAVLRGHGPNGSDLPVLTVSAVVGADEATRRPTSNPPISGGAVGPRATQPSDTQVTPPSASEGDRFPSTSTPFVPEAPSADDSVAGLTPAGKGSETSSRRSSDSTVTTRDAGEQPERSGDSVRTVIRPPVRDSDDHDGDD